MTDETPVNVRIGSYSEISSARQCPHKHVLQYQQRWVGEKTSPALARGTHWHNCMELWYQAIQAAQKVEGMSAQQEILQWARNAIPSYIRDEVSDEKERALLFYMWDGYQEQWGEDDNWEIIMVEEKVIVPLPTDRGGRSRFRLKFKADVVIRERDTGRVAVIDHKTARNMPNDKEFSMDDQFGLYVWGLRQVGIDCFSAIHSVARTFMPAPDDRPKDEQGRSLNKDGTVSKQQPAGSTLEERFKRTRMYRTDKELHSIAVEAYKTLRAVWMGGADYRVPGDHCRYRCEFMETCLAGRKGQDERRMLLAGGFRQDFTRH